MPMVLKHTLFLLDTSVNKYIEGSKEASWELEIDSIRNYYAKSCRFCQTLYNWIKSYMKSKAKQYQV